jgi:hypothetical protein
MSDYVIMPSTDYQDICDAVREKTGETDLLKSGDVAEKIDGLEPAGSRQNGVAEGIEQGRQAGYVEGHEAGVVDGAKSEHDSFWDAFQDYGKRSSYGNTFRGEGWNDTTFKPKYDIIVGEWDNNLFVAAGITDLKGILEAQGVLLDTSKATNGTSWFQNSYVTRIPPIDARNMTSCSSMFNGCVNLQGIEMNNVREDMTGNTITYSSCQSLTTIKVTGSIGASTVVNFKWSPLLSNGSVQSVIDCLKDLTGLASQTLTFHADVGAKMTEQQKATITAKNWTLVY